MPGEQARLHTACEFCFCAEALWRTIDAMTHDGGRSSPPTARPSARAAPSQSQRAKALRGPANARGRQVIRQLSILRLLESSRHGLTIAELHQAIVDGDSDNCSQRTIYRDIEQLQLAGFQLDEHDARWSLYRKGTSLQSWPLKASEVLTLLLSEDLLSPTATGTIGVALRDLRQRLMTNLSPNGRAMVTELRAANRATSVAPLRSTDHDTVFAAIDDAFGREHCLRLRYSTPGKRATERVVEPHLFWVHQGRPYLVAYCRSAQTFRTFAVQRVQLAEVLDESFDRRVEFDPTAFIERGFGMLQGEVHPIRVEFSAEVAHLAHERRWHHTQQVIPTAEGSVVLSMTAAGLPEIAAWIASFGGKVRALAPTALVDAVRELHERGLEAHPRE